MSAYHSVSVALYTWTAKQGCVPLPNDEPGSVSPLSRPSSPLQSVGCVQYTHACVSPHDLLGCHTLCLGTGAGASPVWARVSQPLWPVGWHPATWCRDGSLLPLSLRVAHHLLPLAGCASRLSSLGQWGCARYHPPKTGFAHRPVRRLPLPTHPSKLVTLLQKHSPHPLKHSHLHLWKVRCTLLSSGNSVGKWFHWQPLRILKMMASSASRASILPRPVGLGGSSSLIIGLTRSHNSSLTRQIVGIVSGPSCVCRSFFGLPICF